MPSTAYTPSLPGLTTTDDLDTVINWGLGADSTAYLAEMLTDPAAYGIDLERTVVLHMATGSEWPETRLLVDIGKSGYWDLRNGGRADPSRATRSRTPASSG
ncbi:hypothetical protein ACWGKK_36735 [Streptomyces chartreusis]